MASLNRVEVMGRVGQDPKLTYLSDGTPVAELSVAVDESYKGKDGQKVEKVEWVPVKVFGPHAEFVSKWVAKGKLVLVEGAYRTRSWEKEGVKHYKTEVVVSGPGKSVQPIEWPDRDGQGQGQPRGQQNGQQRPSQGANGPQRQGGYGGQQRPREEDMGPAFPSEASGLDDVPF